MDLLKGCLHSWEQWAFLYQVVLDAGFWWGVQYWLNLTKSLAQFCFIWFTNELYGWTIKYISFLLLDVKAKLFLKRTERINFKLHKWRCFFYIYICHISSNIRLPKIRRFGQSTSIYIRKKTFHVSLDLNCCIDIGSYYYEWVKWTNFLLAVIYGSPCQHSNSSKTAQFTTNVGYKIDHISKTKNHTKNNSEYCVFFGTKKFFF